MAMCGWRSAKMCSSFVLLFRRGISASAPALSQFKSSLSLDKLYPNSSLDITKTPQIPESTGDNFSGYIPIDRLQITYSRSGGPGGQNVNKVNTKVDLRFHVESATWLPQSIRTKLLAKLKNHLTKEGFCVIQSERTRSQQLNLADAMEKLRETIRVATYIPPKPSEETLENVRRRHEKAVRERLREKRQHSATKMGRRSPTVSDCL